MKTTIELADDLLRSAKRIAADEGITLRELVEAGLRQQLESREYSSYVMGDASFGGNGVQTGVVEGDWETIRGLIYEGRGA